MRVTYIGFGDFHRFAGMKQLYHFAQEISRRQHSVQILIAGNADTESAMDGHSPGEVTELAFVGPRLADAVRDKVVRFQPDLIHVWTPRFVPALAGWQIHRLTGSPMIVDHEDDEDFHVRYMHKAWVMNWHRGFRRLAIPLIVARNTAWPWMAPLRPDGSARRAAADPITYRLLMAAAAASTAISPALVRWAEGQWPGKPAFLLYPGADLNLFHPQPKDPALMAELNLENRFVIAYSGTMDVAIFSWCMNVLQEIVARKPDIALLLIGEDRFRAEAEAIAAQHGLQSHYRLVGQRPYPAVPAYLSLADILLQHPLDIGNTMRLPAKLPEYLATGKPVITYASGIGQSLEDGRHVRKLHTDQPSEAARLILELVDRPEERCALGQAARSLAQERFDWSTNGEHLMAIYAGVLAMGRGSGR